jgi:hypothetical protein
LVRIGAAYALAASRQVDSPADKTTWSERRVVLSVLEPGKGKIMRNEFRALIGASFLALASCGGDGDDALGENAAEAAEAQAENMEAVADVQSNEAVAGALENQADAVEKAGEAKGEAIDESDVNAHALSNAQKEAMTNSQ